MHLGAELEEMDAILAGLDDSDEDGSLLDELDELDQDNPDFTQELNHLNDTVFSYDSSVANTFFFNEDIYRPPSIVTLSQQPTSSTPQLQPTEFCQQPTSSIPQLHPTEICQQPATTAAAVHSPTPAFPECSTALSSAYQVLYTPAYEEPQPSSSHGIAYNCPPPHVNKYAPPPGGDSDDSSVLLSSSGRVLRSSSLSQHSTSISDFKTQCVTCKGYFTKSYLKKHASTCKGQKK